MDLIIIWVGAATLGIGLTHLMHIASTFDSGNIKSASWLIGLGFFSTGVTILAVGIRMMFG